jgi:hypothetical protein
MPDDSDDLDFGSLFDDTSKQNGDDITSELPGDDLFSFDGADESPLTEEVPQADAPEQTEQEPQKKKRTSRDFEPNMDALLLTAQSSMIIEGMKYMSQKTYNAKALPVYMEAIRGLDLFIKILERNPNNYYKLTEIINMDIDCSEVEKISFNVYRNRFNDYPSSDSQKLKAYEIFRDRLRNAYYKCLISQTMVGMKKYFLMTGSVDTQKIHDGIMGNDATLKSDITKIAQYTNIALEMIKNSNTEIASGMKGRDINIFVIRATEILSYYYSQTGQLQTADYYQRLHENYKKYFVIR